MKNKIDRISRRAILLVIEPTEPGAIGFSTLGSTPNRVTPV